MTDYRLNQEDIQVFIGPLKEILAQELRAGNTVKETWRGDWPYPHVIAVSLSKPFLTPVKKDMWNIDFRNINDIHYWKAEYYDRRNNEMLVCGFSTPADLRYEY